MFRSKLRVVTILTAALCLGFFVAAAPESGTKRFPASPGGTLVLDLKTGASVKVTGDGGSGISVTYSGAGHGSGEPGIEFTETDDGLRIVTRFQSPDSHQNSSVDIDVHVPSPFDIDLDSTGGGLEIVGLEGTFRGKTMGGELKLHDVKGEARLKTMGGEIQLTDSELDGSLETMGGEVLFRDVTGDVKGSSMGGEVRFQRVYRRDGSVASPGGVEDVPGLTDGTVQISTMGGAIDVDEAPEGVAVHTMGGDIVIAEARRFAKVTTMGGDIHIEAVDGWVAATTMGGDVEVRVDGAGGDVDLRSNSGNITLVVPSGFSMNLDLELAFTRDSGRDYKIATDFTLPQTVTDEWDYSQGSPRRYIRAAGAVGGGEHRVKIRTINGDLRIRYGG
jgi:DUF4097 and DUF4098 domain-containing protein YvlB